jgi:hypothetical protein
MRRAVEEFLPILDELDYATWECQPIHPLELVLWRTRYRDGEAGIRAAWRYFCSPQATRRSARISRENSDARSVPRGRPLAGALVRRASVETSLQVEPQVQTTRLYEACRGDEAVAVKPLCKR